MKKQIIYKCCGLILLIFLFSGCLKTVETDIPEGKLPSEGYVTVTVQVPGVNAPSTYASISEDQEDEIQQLDVLAFIEEGGEDLFSYRVPIAPKEIQSSNGKKTFTIHLKRLDVGVKLTVLANCASPLNALQSNNILVEGFSKEALIDSLVYYTHVWDDLSDFSTGNKGFPMWGETSNEINATLLEQNGSNISEEVKLLRALARIDIGVDKYGDPAIGFGKRFKLKTVYIYRANNSGRIIPDKDLLLAGEPTLIESSELVNPTFPYVANAVDANFMERSIYIAEAKKGSPTNEGICMVIEASLDDEDPTFYRIDFIDKNGEFLPILRNHRYEVNITNIAGKGYATALEASRAKSSSIQYGIEVEDESINNIVFNEQYMLGLGENLLVLDWYEGAKNTLNISTDYEGGWTLELPNNSWIKLEEGGGNVTKTGNIYSGVPTSGNNSYKITIEAVSQNQESLYREETITFKAGVLENRVTIRQRMGANCFMVYPGESVKIPVVFANADGTERITNNVTYTYEVLWTDQPNLLGSITPTGTGKSSILNVSTQGQEGNALIAVKDGGTNEILWSWHIWITEYKPDENGRIGTDLKYNNGVIFMDRNLGAYAENSSLSKEAPFGLVYQWGRKDPFPGATESTTPNSFEGQPIYAQNTSTDILYKQVELDDNFEEAIATPTTFYTSAQAPYYNWMGLNNADNHLWSDPKGNKTAYDPCPSGWRVPTSGGGSLSPWYGLTPAGNNWESDWGWNWNGAGFYPAAGGRLNDTGAFSDVGIRGYVWSASPASTGAYLFRYGSNANAFRTDGSSYRANAYPVRCAKE